MANINEGFLNLSDDYLFYEISKKANEFQKENKDTKIISLGIGDVSLPLVKPVIDAMHKATDEMSKKETFRGYGLVQGYDFLIEKIIKNDYEKRGIHLDKDEVFISAGTKGDLAGIIGLFSLEDKVALVDPVYPAYRDTNIMMGRKEIKYIRTGAENNFIPEVLKEHVDIIYLCSPNNPTGVALNKEELTKWVKYAQNQNSIILYDSVYECFITEENIPHSIYEIEGAKEVAIEFRSYSKIAGFTGVRCSYTVVPKELKAFSKNGTKMNLNNLWRRKQSSNFGAASYITQRAAEAIYSEEGQKAIKENINYYLKNAKLIKLELQKLGFTVYGGTNSPYIWLKTPKHMKSWDFFDKLLKTSAVIGTPGVGFGECGEGYFRLTAFSSKEDTKEAIERIKKIF